MDVIDVAIQKFEAWRASQNACASWSSNGVPGKYANPKMVPTEEAVDSFIGEHPQYEKYRDDLVKHAETRHLNSLPMSTAKH